MTWKGLHNTDQLIVLFVLFWHVPWHSIDFTLSTHHDFITLGSLLSSSPLPRTPVSIAFFHSQSDLDYSFTSNSIYQMECSLSTLALGKFSSINSYCLCQIIHDLIMSLAISSNASVGFPCKIINRHHVFLLLLFKTMKYWVPAVC